MTHKEMAEKNLEIARIAARNLILIGMEVAEDAVEELAKENDLSKAQNDYIKNFIREFREITEWELDVMID